MDGIIPLINHVPDKAPTNNKIKIAPVIDLRFDETVSIIYLNKTPFFNPIIIAIAAPNNNINWFDPFMAESPYT
tara:strand:+ start:593 stop:814 length:222 start_codon:yes stop_codon:yes gene_type:complete